METFNEIALWVGHLVIIGSASGIVSAIIIYVGALLIEWYLKNYDLTKEFLLWYKEKLIKERDE